MTDHFKNCPNCGADTFARHFNNVIEIDSFDGASWHTEATVWEDLEPVKVECTGCKAEVNKEKSEEIEMIVLESQICLECGKSVKPGSGKWVNRVHSGSGLERHKEMGYPYPWGEYICEECWEKKER